MSGETLSQLVFEMRWFAVNKFRGLRLIINIFWLALSSVTLVNRAIGL